MPASPWVVDTCLIIDVLENDPTFGSSSAAWLDTHRDEGLTICPISYTELAPAFEGSRELQDQFLNAIGIDFSQPWLSKDTLQSHSAWHAHIRRRRDRSGPKRPFPDILIGSWAMRFRGLMTRNAKDFATTFPELEFSIPCGSED